MTKLSEAPDFIIGGAPRSGTTFLCTVLDQHSAIYMAKPYIPEPKVFMGTPKEDAEYRADYQRLFSDAPADAMCGEKTSYYLESAACCDLLRQHVPDARLIFIVREPVGRAYSNFLWSTKNGIESLSFEEAVSLEGKRPDPMAPERSYARPFDYMSRGNYAMFAQWYIEAFGHNQVQFFLYEDISLRPQVLLKAVQEFIGVETEHLESFKTGRINSARESGMPINPGTKAMLRERMSPLVSQFADITGLDISAWGY